MAPASSFFSQRTLPAWSRSVTRLELRSAISTRPPGSRRASLGPDRPLISQRCLPSGPASLSTPLGGLLLGPDGNHDGQLDLYVTSAVTSNVSKIGRAHV